MLKISYVNKDFQIKVYEEFLSELNFQPPTHEVKLLEKSLALLLTQYDDLNGGSMMDFFCG